jgi:hypothetical protein
MTRAFYKKRALRRQNKKNIGSVEILNFLSCLEVLCCCEGDPLSPPEGEAAQGGYPLTPLSCKVLDQPPYPAKARRGARANPDRVGMLAKFKRTHS